jgi:hypothetical protein
MKEFKDREQTEMNGKTVVCNLIQEPKSDPCLGCYLESSSYDEDNCNQVACIPTERTDKMYARFQEVKK